MRLYSAGRPRDITLIMDSSTGKLHFVSGLLQPRHHGIPPTAVVPLPRRGRAKPHWISHFTCCTANNEVMRRKQLCGFLGKAPDGKSGDVTCEELPHGSGNPGEQTRDGCVRAVMLQTHFNSLSSLTLTYMLCTSPCCFYARLERIPETFLRCGTTSSYPTLPSFPTNPNELAQRCRTPKT